MFSKNLMEALGMDMTMVDREATDWCPPARAGLDNSRAIIETEYNSNRNISSSSDFKSNSSELDWDETSSTVYTESNYDYGEKPITNITMSPVSIRDRTS